jgi:copper chaperone
MAKTFKTNLQCGGCLAAAKPFLDEALGADQWSVDLSHEDRLLTVPNADVPAEKVRIALDQAGFEAQLVEKKYP